MTTKQTGFWNRNKDMFVYCRTDIVDLKTHTK